MHSTHIQRSRGPLQCGMVSSPILLTSQGPAKQFKTICRSPFPISRLSFTWPAPCPTWRWVVGPPHPGPVQRSHCSVLHRRLGGKLNREIVSFRLCVRSPGLVVEWKFGSNVRVCTFPFPFWPSRFSFFPSGIRVRPK